MKPNTNFDTTLGWIRFEYPVHSIDRLNWEKTLKQVRGVPCTEPVRDLPKRFKEAA